MRNLTLGVVSLALLAVAALAYFSLGRPPETPVRTPARSASQIKPTGPAPALSELSAPVAPEPPIQVSPTPDLRSLEEPKSTPPQQPVVAATKPPKQPKEPLKDPDARIALKLVGADPEADAYWYGAINNPELSPHERKDLIEDLNEEGFADPKHPSPEEIPLIVGRLSMIEELAGDAMDQTNFEAFQEAYQDLVKMYAKLTSTGQF
jgi:hypothetical protein